jgi:hypothetical protein
VPKNVIPIQRADTSEGRPHRRPWPAITRGRAMKQASSAPIEAEAELATGRNRQTASRIILAKLEAGLKDAVFDGNRGLGAGVVIGSTAVLFIHSPDGLYFRIFDDYGATLMTGYIDPYSPGRYARGRFAPMTWRRGWEWKLFESRPPTRKKRSRATLKTPESL